LNILTEPQAGDRSRGLSRALYPNIRKKSSLSSSPSSSSNTPRTQKGDIPNDWRRRRHPDRRNNLICIVGYGMSALYGVGYGVKLNY